MSEISISIGGSAAGTMIDTNSMRERLESMKNQINKAIESGVGDADALSDRLGKIDGQLDRLDHFENKEITISADRAAMELQRGMNQISDGLGFLMRNGEDMPGAGAIEERLEFWQQKLGKNLDRLNTYG